MRYVTAQRVQNLRLWKAYYAKREEMIEDLGGEPLLPLLLSAVPASLSIDGYCSLVTSSTCDCLLKQNLLRPVQLAATTLSLAGRQTAALQGLDSGKGSLSLKLCPSRKP